MVITVKIEHSELSSIGLPVYKDDTQIGKIIGINESTGDITIGIDSMFDNWIREELNANHVLGISTKKQKSKL